MSYAAITWIVDGFAGDRPANEPAASGLGASSAKRSTGDPSKGWRGLFQTPLRATSSTAITAPQAWILLACGVVAMTVLGGLAVAGLMEKPLPGSPLARLLGHVAPPPAKPTPQLKPQTALVGLLYNQTGRTPQAPFRIRTTTGGDYYVKLVSEGRPSEMVGIYVKGGVPLDVDVPLGSYRLRYAYGSVWYGAKWAFGDATQYFVADKVFSFEASSEGVSGYTVELIAQPNGNLATTSIWAEDF